VVESVFDIIFRCFREGRGRQDRRLRPLPHPPQGSAAGRNPQTGDSIEITARKVLTFKPSKGLKQADQHHGSH